MLAELELNASASLTRCSEQTSTLQWIVFLRSAHRRRFVKYDGGSSPSIIIEAPQKLCAEEVGFREGEKRKILRQPTIKGFGGATFVRGIQGKAQPLILCGAIRRILGHNRVQLAINNDGSAKSIVWQRLSFVCVHVIRARRPIALGAVCLAVCNAIDVHCGVQG